MHVRIISSDTFCRVNRAEKNPKAVNVGSKHDETEPHNMASMHNTSLFAKLSILFNRTVYKRAMPQSPAAAIV